jgi:hypothetical protein
MLIPVHFGILVDYFILMLFRAILLAPAPMALRVFGQTSLFSREIDSGNFLLLQKTFNLD